MSLVACIDFISSVSRRRHTQVTLLHFPSPSFLARTYFCTGSGGGQFF